MLSRGFRVLMVTSEWPSSAIPNAVPFLVRQVEFLKRAGVDVDVFHFQGRRKIANYWRAWRGVQSRLSERRYDLIHAHWGQSALVALPKRLPLVVTFYGSDLEGIVGKGGSYTFSGHVLRAVSRTISRLADQVIVVAESLGRLAGLRRFHVIPTGMDMDVFRPIPQTEARRQLGLPENKSLILFAADPKRPVKRYHLAESAVAMLNGRLNAELVVASGVPSALMPVYMNACDVLLLTSAHEGSPTVVQEALGCNVPVVSVDVGDVRQRIGSVDGCVLCQEDSPAAIAAGLAKVLRDRRRLDARDAVGDADHRVLTKKIMAVYKQATSVRL